MGADADVGRRRPLAETPVVRPQPVSASGFDLELVCGTG